MVCQHQALEARPFFAELFHQQANFLLGIFPGSEDWNDFQDEAKTAFIFKNLPLRVKQTVVEKIAQIVRIQKSDWNLLSSDKRSRLLFSPKKFAIVWPNWFRVLIAFPLFRRLG